MTAPSTIPFLDLARLHASIGDELAAVIDDIVERSAFVGGDGSSFEAEFADAHGRSAAAGCGSGTDALALALRAAGIGPGDEVIVPSMTFVATAEAVVHVGAIPVVADVNPHTLLLDHASVDLVRTPNTRAVVPVHLFGHVVPFDALEHWAGSGLIVIEDAAQAHLATWEGRSVGSVGRAACFSFYPGKNLGALGDGGAVVSDDVELIDHVRALRDHGRRTKYVHETVGWCSRLDGIQAAVLRCKLRHLPEWTNARRRLADRYRDDLGDLLVPWEDGAVHHLLVARVPAARRDEIRGVLSAQGIQTGTHYPVPLSLQPWLAVSTPSTPAAELAASEVLSLPMDPLMTTAEVARVAAGLRAAVDS